MADSKQQYVPVATAVPLAVFADIGHVNVPTEYSHVISPQLWSIFNFATTITIRQHTKILPKSCCTCPPCVKQENTYSVYAGIAQKDEHEFMRIDEVSNDWNRCCCAPYHPLKLEARSYVPLPGDGHSSDFSHIAADVRASFETLTGRDRTQKMRDFYKSQPVLFTMVRRDGQRCCALPCKWLSTFVCCGCCQDGMDTYAGQVNEDPSELGRVEHPPQNQLIGSVIQPCGGGWCIPLLYVRNGNNESTEEPYAKIEGPCFFGGCIEFCCSFNFYTSTYNGPSKAGDLALIVKKKPGSLAGMARELFSDADVFEIKYRDQAQLSPQQKIGVLTGQMLADYMFFDGNTEKCRADDTGLTIYCCYYTCIGALCPCYIYIPKQG